MLSRNVLKDVPQNNRTIPPDARDVKLWTISRGEEKKMEITQHLLTKNLETRDAGCITQKTEDATKWNECLAPSAFALMHIYLFDDNIIERAIVKKATE